MLSARRKRLHKNDRNSEFMFTFSVKHILFFIKQGEARTVCLRESGRGAIRDVGRGPSQ